MFSDFICNTKNNPPPTPGWQANMIIEKICNENPINFPFLLPIFFLNMRDACQAGLSHNRTLAAATVVTVDQPRPNI